MDNVILVKSKAFAIRIVGLYKYLTNDKNEFVLSKQILKSGTSIGANVVEAVNSQTRAEFHAKMYISFKEANETLYWLDLLYETMYIFEKEYNSIVADCRELVAILSSITKTTKLVKDNEKMD